MAGGELTGWVPFAAAGVIASVGVVSTLLCVRARRGVDAGLVAVAALALAVLVCDLSTATRPSGTQVVGAGLAPGQVRAAAALSLQGEGLRAAEWQDLPSRPLQRAPTPSAAASAPRVTLDFPRQLALGRPFELTLQRSPAVPRWRLQLLDENGQLLAQATADASGGQATLRWLPPVAEAMVLQARVLDADGQVLEHGPLPLQVQAGLPLQVQGRFGAPSFDVQALNNLLVGSDALLDWQVTLGKTIKRQETPRAALGTADLVVIDAAYFERAPAPVRAALLAQVAQGLPLLVLATNASEPALWARELQLPLVATEGEITRTLGPDATLVLPLAALAPAAGAPGRARLGPWTANDDAAPWLWQRRWQAGRIAWLGVSDWHRAAIGSPQALGAWWQTVLDQTGVRRAAALAWTFPDAMPVAGERSRVCARGAQGARDLNTELTIDLPGLNQRLQLQRRDDSADAACAAFWPRQAGWQRVQGVALATAPAAPLAPSGAVYVYATDDWPAWQRALRDEASARYAARALPVLEPFQAALPAWPWALAFLGAMLTLWWRERR